MIDKNAMRYMKQRYFGSTDEPNDVEYIQRFFPKKNREDVSITLGTLQAGEFIYKFGHKQQLVQIKPFTTRTKSQQLTPKPVNYNIEKLIVNKPKLKPTDDTKAWISLFTAILFVLAIIIIVGQR